LLSRKIQHWDDKIARLYLRCDFYEGNPKSSFGEGQKEVINIDYNSQLQNILDEFLSSN